MKEIHKRIDSLVYGENEKPSGAVSGWSQRVFQEIAGSPKEVAWRGLFLHWRSLTLSNASRKWQQEALTRVELIGSAEFLEIARCCLALGPMPDMPTQLQVPEDEADYQKGFIWTLGALGDTSMVDPIADFAFACFRKIPQIGACEYHWPIRLNCQRPPRSRSRIRHAGRTPWGREMQPGLLKHVQGSTHKRCPRYGERRPHDHPGPLRTMAEARRNILGAASALVEPRP